MIYCLDNNIPIKRCTESFTYEIDGKIKRYFPDFVVKGVIIEIKNYWREEVDLKVSAVKKAGKKIKVFYTRDLEKMMTHVDKKYNLSHKGRHNSYYVLYDNYKPKYKYVCLNCGKSFLTERRRRTKNTFCSPKCAHTFSFH